MANWDHVLPYTREFADWLEEQGYPGPPVRAGNRLPSTGEICAAVRMLAGGGEPGQSEGDRLYVSVEGEPEWVLCLSGLAWDDAAAVPAESFRVRGLPEYEVPLLIDLAEQCGQLLAFPDSGEVPLLVEPGQSPEVVAAAYRVAQEDADPARRYFSELYGAPPG